MIKFIELSVIVVLVLLTYLVFRQERFIQSFEKTLQTKQFNFGRDSKGYSQADKYLSEYIQPHPN